MLKAAFIFEDVESAPARWRVTSHIDLFEAHGIDLYPMELPGSAGLRRRFFRDLSHFHITVLCRSLLLPWNVRALKKNARVLGFDFDDAVIFPPGEGRDAPSFTRKARFRSIMRAADFVTIENRRLASLCPPAAQPRFIVPTSVDTDTYVPAEPTDGPLRIGWMGPVAAQKHLQPLLPMLKKLVSAHNECEFVVISDDCDPSLAGFARTVNWGRHIEPAEIAALDAALVPLGDTPRTRGSSPAQLLLYAASAVPAVASRNQSTRRIVLDGRTGFLAETVDEWEKALGQLVENPERRRSMGQAARNHVQTYFPASQIIPKWAAILKDAAAGAPLPRRA